MPRIANLDLVQINKQIDILDSVSAQVSSLQKQLNNVSFQTAVSDPIHAPSTTNNLVYTWTGSSTTLSWNQGFIKDKNWKAQTTSQIPPKSAAPGSQHMYGIPSGNLTLNHSTYYWIGWDTFQQKMVATTDASELHGNYNVHILCQLYTGTTGQTGFAGGGGSNGGVDLSGLTYKNF
jgi:hypothetical protein